MKENKYDVDVFFNFRSPYCYLASKNMFSVFDEYNVNLLWKPFGGWGGRSSPDRVKMKIHLVRQDVARSCAKMGIPFSPPPAETNPTLAGAISFVAEQEGLLKPYVVEVMRKEWAEGHNIGDLDVIQEVAEKIGLPQAKIEKATNNKDFFTQLEKNWQEAQTKGVIGVPTFTIEDQIFWGNDRIDSLKEHLQQLRLRKI
ncbi:MAG TPA: 2-hydroxychromene-2-carboxylate isomerase [Cycloclasticus sp.]|jgi:2-hydroxychromene-2-carboxylate isomerase|nr:2-hydroxychromene-2-carboxylate isomerase [Cycloclasticus sp.]HIL92805.1 2-hydroxychromene-2-carboxylate isomerase [Cycloclasticus sp.]